MAKQQSGESKAPLVVALAFFVLTTLTLGVLTYMAYSDVAVQKAAAKQAESDKQAAVSKATEEQAKVLMYKTLVGTNTQEEFDNLKNGGKADAAKQEFEAFKSALVNRLKGVETKAAKDFVGTNKQFAIAPEAVVAWNWTGSLENPPQTPMIDAVANGYARQMLAAVRLETETTALNQAKTTYLDALKRAQEAEAGFKKLSADFPAQVAEVQKKADELIQATRQTFAGDTSKYTADMKTKAEALEMAGIKLREAQAKNDGLTQRVDRVEQKASDTQDPFAHDAPHGKIVGKRSNIVDIDLGSADNVRPGLTFSVQPHDAPTAGLMSRVRPRVGADGRPVMDGNRQVMDVQPKGTIEVIAVLGAHLSQARITSNPDPIRDALLVGDVLYNPAWKKGAADRVALFGVFDVDSDGTDDVKRVVADLTKMGITVDAYFDLETKKWVGQVTEQTTYAVEGYFPVLVGGDPLAAAKSDITQALIDARNNAKEKGVQVVKARTFFPRAGYKIRMDVSNDTINRAYNRYLQTLPVGGGTTPGN
ncbi:MAG TPA: hypothetical protein VM597_27515 [Gemmataceae bacterium]|jgi:hypothetical protein|nr:hypothetical protein [Gemmataceae bacterium]